MRTESIHRSDRYLSMITDSQLTLILMHAKMLNGWHNPPGGSPITRGYVVVVVLMPLLDSAGTAPPPSPSAAHIRL
jgi:hypothetical protein